LGLFQALGEFDLRDPCGLSQRFQGSTDNPVVFRVEPHAAQSDKNAARHLNRIIGY
jgi:hypothetical protein